MNRRENTEAIFKGLRIFMDERRLPLSFTPSEFAILEQYLSDLEKHQTGIFNLPPGFGSNKIVTAIALAYLSQIQYTNPKGKMIIVVPSLSDMENDNGTLEEINTLISNLNRDMELTGSFLELLNIGKYYGKKKDIKNQIIVTTYRSLESLRAELERNNELDDFGLVLLTKAHHAVSDDLRHTIQKFKNAAIYGTTPTPAYDSQRHLGKVLGDVIATVDFRQSIEEGNRADVKNAMLSIGLCLDLSQVPYQNGEWSEAEIDKAIKNAASSNVQYTYYPKTWKEAQELIAKSVVEHYATHEDDEPRIGRLCDLTDPNNPKLKSCVVNVNSQETAKIVEKAFNDYFGRKVAAVWTMDTKDKSVLDNFEKGIVSVLCQVGRLPEDYHLPKISVCFNFPTHSLVREMQRGDLALHNNDDPTIRKLAYIVDVVILHPLYRDNPVLSAHANKQWLFADVVGAPVVKMKDDEERKTGRLVENKGGLPLTGFEVFYNSTELMRIFMNARLNESRNSISLKRPGMFNARDLQIRILASGKKISLQDMEGQLHKCYEENIKFTGQDETEHFLVERVRNLENGKIEFALHEDPSTIDLFLTHCPEDWKRIHVSEELIKSRGSIETKRDGMLNARDLQTRIFAFGKKVSLKDMNEQLQKCYEDYITFTGQDGADHFLVEKVRNPDTGKLEYALHEDPNTVDLLLQGSSKYWKKVLSSDESTLLYYSHDYYSYGRHYYNKYGFFVDCKFEGDMTDLLNKLYFEKFEDPKTGIEKGFVYFNKDGRYVVANDPNIKKALIERIVEKYPEYLSISEGTKALFKGSFGTYRDIIVECYQQRKTFNDSKTNTQKPLVIEEFDANGVPSIDLDPSQDAIFTFVDFLLKNNEKFKLKVEGRYQEAVKSQESIFYDIIKPMYLNGKTFEDVNGAIKPIVTLKLTNNGIVFSIDPQAETDFENIVLSNFDVSKEHVHIEQQFLKKYGITDRVESKAEETYLNKKTFIDPATNKEEPIVTLKLTDNGVVFAVDPRAELDFANSNFRKYIDLPIDPNFKGFEGIDAKNMYDFSRYLRDEIYHEGKTFTDPETGEEKPLVTLKSTDNGVVLTVDPKGEKVVMDLIFDKKMLRVYYANYDMCTDMAFLNKYPFSQSIFEEQNVERLDKLRQSIAAFVEQVLHKGYYVLHLSGYRREYDYREIFTFDMNHQERKCVVYIKPEMERMVLGVIGLSSDYAAANRQASFTMFIGPVASRYGSIFEKRLDSNSPEHLERLLKACKERNKRFYDPETKTLKPLVREEVDEYGISYCVLDESAAAHDVFTRILLTREASDLLEVSSCYSKTAMDNDFVRKYFDNLSSEQVKNLTDFARLVYLGSNKYPEYRDPSTGKPLMNVTTKKEESFKFSPNPEAEELFLRLAIKNDPSLENYLKVPEEKSVATSTIAEEATVVQTNKNEDAIQETKESTTPVATVNTTPKTEKHEPAAASKPAPDVNIEFVQKYFRKDIQPAYIKKFIDYVKKMFRSGRTFTDTTNNKETPLVSCKTEQDRDVLSVDSKGEVIFVEEMLGKNPSLIRSMNVKVDEEFISKLNIPEDKYDAVVLMINSKAAKWVESNQTFYDPESTAEKPVFVVVCDEDGQCNLLFESAKAEERFISVLRKDGVIPPQPPVPVLQARQELPPNAGPQIALA